VGWQVSADSFSSQVSFAKLFFAKETSQYMQPSTTTIGLLC